MLTTFYSALHLPACKQIVHLKQMNSNTFLQLQKYIIEDSDELINEFLMNLIKECMREQEIFDSLNCIDKLACLMKIRSISCGDTVVFSNQQNVQGQISMNHILNCMHDINFNVSALHDNNQVQVMVSLPHTLLLPNISSVIQSCLNAIIFNDSKIEMQKMPNEHVVEILNNLDSHTASYIYKFINNYADDLTLTVFTGNATLQLESIILSPFNNSMLDFCKFILKDDLLNLYKNIHTLCSKSHLTPEFLMNIPPIEQQLYTKLLIDEIEQTNKQLTEEHRGINMPAYGQV